MSRRALHLIAFVLVLGPVPSAAGQQDKPRMAIKAFDNPPVSRNSTIGDAVADILFTELGRTGQFRLVERDAFDQIAQEIDFGSSGWVEEGSASEAGGLLGAEFILMGTVSNFSYDEEGFRDRVRTSRGVVEVTRYRQNASVRVDFRVVSTSTGVAVLTESGTARQSNVSDTAELATFRSLVRSGSFTGEALNSLIGRTTVDAVQDMVRKISDLSGELSAYSTRESVSSATASLDELVGQVTGIVDGAIFTDLGADHGLQVGDQLEVFVEDVTRDDAGEVLFRDERTLGVLEVTAVNPDATRTELVSTPESAPRQPREGDDVRVDTARAALMRGGTTSAAAAPAPAGGDTLTESEAGRLVRRAERYLEDRYYAQAVDYYQQALALEPGSLEVMDGLASALLYNRQFLEAEDTILRLFAAQASFTLEGVVHDHFMGRCEGSLSLAPTGIEFAPEEGDHGFATDASRILSMRLEDESEPSSFEVRISTGPDDDENFDFVVPIFLEQGSGLALGGLLVAKRLSGEDGALEDTTRLHRVLVRVVEDHVLAR